MVKTISKRILCILLLCLIAICFCACSTVTVSTVTNTDGSIDEVIYITLDREIIADKCADIDDIKSDIANVVTQESRQIIHQYNHVLNERIVFATNQDTRQALLELMNGINILPGVWDGDVYHAGIRFKNKDVYRYHYSIPMEVTRETTIEEHFLYNKVSYQSYTMYATYHDLYNRLLPHFDNKLYSEFELSDTQFIYTYIAENSRLHSDADIVEKINGKYYHSWIVENNNELITFYYNIANRTNWIICAIGITLLVGVVLCCVIITRKNKNKIIIN